MTVCRALLFVISGWKLPRCRHRFGISSILLFLPIFVENSIPQSLLLRINGNEISHVGKCLLLVSGKAIDRGVGSHVIKCRPSDTPKYTSTRRGRTFMLEGSSVDFTLGVVRECVRKTRGG
jgi:hypothetical protein